MTCGSAQERPALGRASGACTAGASESSVFQRSSVPSQSSSSPTLAPWLSMTPSVLAGNGVANSGARIVNFKANQPVHGRSRNMSIGSVPWVGHDVRRDPRSELKRWFSKE